MRKQPLLIIAGPTASGKSALAVRLAQRFNGEVISADSMQVYRGMDIGTAKVTPEEMDGVPHHLIDICDPAEEWNVMNFCRLAAEKIRDIAARGKLPIVAGGTGFYIHALAYGAQFDEEGEERAPRRRELMDMPLEALHAYLAQIDAKSAEAIHPNNRKRVVRAIEYYEQTGQPFSAYNATQKERQSPYELCYLVLDMPRPLLYERIDRRVDMMLEQGLVEEVKRLQAAGCTADMVSMKGLGYKEILAYLQGELSLEEAVYLVKRDTRHFAKRQLTWMRHEEEAVFIDCLPTETLADRAAALVKEKFS